MELEDGTKIVKGYFEGKTNNPHVNTSCSLACSTPMSQLERQNAIAELKEICQEIGCSGVEPNMCKNKPHCCSIIRRLVA